jgi:hypothetical protein
MEQKEIEQRRRIIDDPSFQSLVRFLESLYKLANWW